jgi:hypothetical protein
MSATWEVVVGSFGNGIEQEANAPLQVDLR